MTKETPSLASLTDEQLLSAVMVLVQEERQATANLVAALSELDRRRLYLQQGHSSLFSYCVHALHLSEDAAYNRIRVARMAARWPVVIEMLGGGVITLTNLRLLSDAITEENHLALLSAARHKTKKQMQELLATVSPKPDAPATVRKVPEAQRSAVLPLASVAVSAPLPVKTAHASPAAVAAAPRVPASPRPIVAPLSAERFKIQVTVDRATRDNLTAIQDLLRHQIPNGDPAAIISRALALLLKDLRRSRLAEVNRPRLRRGVVASTRHVPAAVRREVWQRDGGRCAYAGASGRCTERGCLEFHHVVPFAEGGATTVENLQLRCRAHNAFEAEQHFGPLFVREAAARYIPHRVAGISSHVLRVEEIVAP